jgi:hypothetical protein
MLATGRVAPFASFVRRSQRAGAVCASAILFFNIFMASPLAAQDQSPKPVEDVVAVGSQDALTKTIADRVRQTWAAWKKGDAAAFAALTTDDYRELAATGTQHFYRFTSQEFAAFPITQFTISQLQAMPIGQEGALVTYVGLITFQNGGPIKFAFGEVWVKEGDLWKCKYSQATTMLVP